MSEQRVHGLCGGGQGVKVAGLLVVVLAYILNPVRYPPRDGVIEGSQWVLGLVPYIPFLCGLWVPYTRAWRIPQWVGGLAVPLVGIGVGLHWAGVRTSFSTMSTLMLMVGLAVHTGWRLGGKVSDYLAGVCVVALCAYIWEIGYQTVMAVHWYRWEYPMGYLFTHLFLLPIPIGAFLCLWREGVWVRVRAVHVAVVVLAVGMWWWRGWWPDILWRDGEIVALPYDYLGQVAYRASKAFLLLGGALGARRIMNNTGQTHTPHWRVGEKGVGHGERVPPSCQDQGDTQGCEGVPSSQTDGVGGGRCGV